MKPSQDGRLTLDALSRLIGQIYDAVIDPALWTVALAETSLFTDADRAVLFHEDGLEPTRSQFQVSIADPAWVRMYLDQYMMINPARLALGRSVKPGEIVLTSDYMSFKQYSQTKFYRDFLSFRDCVDLATAILDMTPTTFTVLGVVRNRAQGFADAETRRRLGLLAPHFRRAVTLSNLFERREMLAGSLADTLDGLKAGVFILGGDAAILHANASAERMLRGEQAFRMANGKLMARDASAQAALAALLDAASRGDPAWRSTEASILFRTGGEQSYLGTVMALAEIGDRRASLGYPAVAALCVREAAAEVPPAVELSLAKRYNLTPREMTVLATIIENSGVPETADILGLSAGTVKTHLKAIFRKTGAARQADLVKLVAGVANPFQK